MDAITPEISLMAIPQVTWKRDALIFNEQLTPELAQEITEGLRKMTEGHQWYWIDLWNMLKALGMDWADYCPDSIALSTANTWRKVGRRFPIEDRKYENLLFSHYVAARNEALELENAHRILAATDAAKADVQAVVEAVKVALGKPERKKNPKVIACPHCDRPAIESLECWGCSYDQLFETMSGLKCAKCGEEFQS